MADIEHLIRIAAPSTTILPLVATADGLRQWWAEDVVAGPGDTVKLGFFDRATVYELTPEGQALPIVAWRCHSGDEWRDTLLRFALTSSGEATALRFTHAGWKARTEYFDSCNTTWGELMYRLKATAEGGSRGPLFAKSAMAY
jgi:Activator of Hsp90 ATPase homolog 1-like protein